MSSLFRWSAGILVGMFILVSPLWSDEERIPITKLPKAVVDAVKAKFPDAELTGAEKETNGDKVFYEVEFKTKGKNAEMLLTADGKVVSTEKVIEARELPKAVADVIQTKFPKATVKKAEETKKNDAVSYQVVVEAADKKTAVLVLDSAGKVLVQQKEVSAKDLPKAVADVIETKFPKATVKKAEETAKNAVVSYTVMLELGDKRTAAIAVDAAGKVLGMRKDLSGAELPKLISDSVEGKFPKSTVTKAVESSRGDTAVYFVRLTTADKKIFQLVVDAKGKIVRESEEKATK